jgi:hypothetical protein
LHFEIRENGKAMNPLPLLGTGTGNGALPTPPPTSWLDQIGTVLGFLSNPASWVRIGLFVLGAALLTIAILKILSTTDTGQTVIKTVKTAAETAAVA